MSKYKRIVLIALCGVLVGLMTFSTFAYSGTPSQVPSDYSNEYVSYIPFNSITFNGKHADGTKELITFDFPALYNATTVTQYVHSTKSIEMNGEQFTPIYGITSEQFNATDVSDDRKYVDIDFTIEDSSLLYSRDNINLTITADDFILSSIDEWFDLGDALSMYGLMGGNSYSIVTCELTLMDRSTIYTSKDNGDGTSTDYASAVAFGFPSATVVWSTTGGGITNNTSFETTLDWGFYVNDEHHEVDINFPNVSEIHGNDIPVYVSDFQISQSIDIPSYQQGIMPITLSYRNCYQRADKAPSSTNLKDFAEARFGNSTIIFVPEDFDYEPKEQVKTNWNFANFVDGSLSIFTTPIFGTFALGHILLIVISIGVLFAVLKYFAGG